jgi:hypothetical protein
MRGDVFWTLLVLCSLGLALGGVSYAVQAETYNVTTDADGFILITAPDSVGLGDEFSVEMSYYFLNQLVDQANLSLIKEGAVIHEAAFSPAS